MASTSNKPGSETDELFKSFSPLISQPYLDHPPEQRARSLHRPASAEEEETKAPLTSYHPTRTADKVTTPGRSTFSDPPDRQAYLQWTAVPRRPAHLPLVQELRRQHQKECLKRAPVHAVEENLVADSSSLKRHSAGSVTKFAQFMTSERTAVPPRCRRRSKKVAQAVCRQTILNPPTTRAPGRSVRYLPQEADEARK